MRETLKANKGKIYTNGEIYGREIYLADGMDKADFYEITNEEYEKILESEVEDINASDMQEINTI